MILINTTTGDVWYKCTQVFIAEKIGVVTLTIKNWEKRSKFQTVPNIEHYKNWTICFNTKRVKQKKGEHLTRFHFKKS